MSEEEDFKTYAQKYVRYAIQQNGGKDALSERVTAIPSTVSFVAGFACGAMSVGRSLEGTRYESARESPFSRPPSPLAMDEVRRVHDMVRLELVT